MPSCFKNWKQWNILSILIESLIFPTDKRQGKHELGEMRLFKTWQWGGCWRDVEISGKSRTEFQQYAKYTMSNNKQVQNRAVLLFLLDPFLITTAWIWHSESMIHVTLTTYNHGLKLVITANICQGCGAEIAVQWKSQC